MDIGHGFIEKKTGRAVSDAPRVSGAGGDLLSHGLAPAVPSALRGLTAEFGMGSGVAPSLWPPTLRKNRRRKRRSGSGGVGDRRARGSSVEAMIGSGF